MKIPVPFGLKVSVEIDYALKRRAKAEKDN